MIRNVTVLDTLPSGRMKSKSGVDGIVEKIKSIKPDSIKDVIKKDDMLMQLINGHMNNNVSVCSEKDGFFRNEWEYIINGSCSDNENFSACKKRLKLVRNALNLAYIYSDPSRTEVLSITAECLTPGVSGLITQAVLAEAWAAAETEKDLRILLDNGRVPFLKTDESWHTDISEILESKEITSQLNEEGLRLLYENKQRISDLKGAKGKKESSAGQSYDDYLSVMIDLLPEKIRLLRIMDLIQINMKYWYYRDFTTYEKMVLLKTVITLIEHNEDWLIKAENYLLEPELIYSINNKVDFGCIRLLFYPDFKRMSFNKKIILFAEKIKNGRNRSEAELIDRFKDVAEVNDWNRTHLFLDKTILRMGNRTELKAG